LDSKIIKEIVIHIVNLDFIISIIANFKSKPIINFQSNSALFLKIDLKITLNLR